MKKATRAALMAAGLRLLLPAVPVELRGEALAVVRRARELRARTSCGEGEALAAALILRLRRGPA